MENDRVGSRINCKRSCPNPRQSLLMVTLKYSSNFWQGRRIFVLLFLFVAKIKFKPDDTVFSREKTLSPSRRDKTTVVNVKKERVRGRNLHDELLQLVIIMFIT